MSLKHLSVQRTSEENGGSCMFKYKLLIRSFLCKAVLRIIL